MKESGSNPGGTDPLTALAPVVVGPVPGLVVELVAGSVVAGLGTVVAVTPDDAWLVPPHPLASKVAAAMAPRTTGILPAGALRTLGTGLMGPVRRSSLCTVC